VDVPVQVCGCTDTSLDVPNRGTTQYMTESHIRSSWVERPERADRAGWATGLYSSVAVPVQRKRTSMQGTRSSLEFTELEAEISSAKMPDILAHILGQIGATMPVILKYP
jgi:hypothetical protein